MISSVRQRFSDVMKELEIRKRMADIEHEKLQLQQSLSDFLPKKEETVVNVNYQLNCQLNCQVNDIFIFMFTGLVIVLSIMMMTFTDNYNMKSVVCTCGVIAFINLFF